ncbi:hypothetical protein BDZ97DRAFT_1756449 [Flammula alnicola]|nr:hypothetical protein BDZ97DRAFT_1756449 [Flammula alnicola]
MAPCGRHAFWGWVLDSQWRLKRCLMSAYACASRTYAGDREFEGNRGTREEISRKHAEEEISKKKGKGRASNFRDGVARSSLDGQDKEDERTQSRSSIAIGSGWKAMKRRNIFDRSPSPTRVVGFYDGWIGVVGSRGFIFSAGLLCLLERKIVLLGDGALFKSDDYGGTQT